MTKMHRVTIVGGGFGGLHAALSLKQAPVQVILIDQRNFHLFQPLLYQVATGGLSPADIASPLRLVLSRHHNVSVVLGEVVGIDPVRRVLSLKNQDGALTEQPYDTLVVSTGSRHHYFGNDVWEPWAPGLKSIEDATTIRSRLLAAFEYAESEPDPNRVRSYLTFVVVGAGPTGVELAGTLAELARDTLRHDFRRIDPANARIVIVERADRVLSSYPHRLSAQAHKSLERLGVEVRLNSTVLKIQSGLVILKESFGEETIRAENIIWAAGVKPSPLGNLLAQHADAELDSSGRVVVKPDLTIGNHPEILVIGDLAFCFDRNGRPLPAVAPVAIQQGKYVAKLIRGRLRNRPISPFRYRNFGNMATIGRHAAVVDLGWIKFSGYAAWTFWLFVHLMYLVGFENRLLVLVQWAWNYITHNRSARLITEHVRLTGPRADRETQRLDVSDRARPR